jgi:hypothetical protein
VAYIILTWIKKSFVLDVDTKQFHPHPASPVKGEELNKEFAF